MKLENLRLIMVNKYGLFRSYACIHLQMDGQNLSFGKVYMEVGEEVC